MKIFSTFQIRELDQFTIENEPVTSSELMERAANAVFQKFRLKFSKENPICILAGPGNNGGDALALTRMLLNENYKVTVYLLFTENLSDDCEINRQRLSKAYPDSVCVLKNNFSIPSISKNTIIIDGLFGSGLSRPLTGIFSEAVKWINQSGCIVVSIDIPSGLNGEENKLIEPVYIVKANYTFSFQFPKLAFLFSENSEFTGKWEILDIGIHTEAIQKTSTDFHFLESHEIAKLLKNRSKFSHKGTFGHSLIIGGCSGMSGAVILSGKATLRSGAGLVTVHSAGCNRTIIQASVPEIIFQTDSNLEYVSHVEIPETANALGVGPGLGNKPESVEMLRNLLKKLNKPCVFDADALNILGEYKELLQRIPKNSILTPHPKEFERMFGNSHNSYEQMLKAQQVAKIYGLVIILKGAHTLIAIPQGKLFFNSTGNAGMATAGSGDVLTGIVTGLLAQNYPPEDAAKIAVFLHGRAGDLSLVNQSVESLIASDLIDNLGKSFKSLRD